MCWRAPCRSLAPVSTSPCRASVVFVSLSVERCCSICLHPFDHALVGAREDRLDFAELGANLQLPPLQLRQREAALMSAQPQLPPDAFGRFRNNGMRQRGHDAESLRRGVQHGCELGARVRVLLFGERPRVRLGDVAIDCRNEEPQVLQRPREIELVELLVELLDGRLGLLLKSSFLLDEIRDSATALYSDTAPRRRSSGRSSTACGWTDCPTRSPGRRCSAAPARRS